MLKMRGDCCKYTKWSSMLLLFFVALFDFFAALVTAQLTAVVNTSSGPVRGIILSTINSVPYAAFKGIPYAEPPLGFLRFQPPLPIKPWTMILNATEDGAKCIQPDVISGANTSTSENCLFINVHTTTTNLAVTPRFLKPVMVWIYGGGFTLGSSTSGFYRPDYLLEKGVVYVAFNYRIGPLGFLSLNHQNATGNAGLKDQVLALKWVKENIAKFGGNPNNVTIFGQSAGASSVGYHILSDASTGLFQAAISMSGSPLSPSAFHTPAKSLLQSINFATHLGTYSVNKETLLKTFYDATPEEILAATSKMMFQNIFPFRPTLENKKIAKDVFLTRCSIANYISGNFTKVPQMLGFTDQETVTFVVAAQYLTGIATEVFDTANNFGVGLSKRLTLVGSAINSTTKVLGSLVDATFDEFIEVSTDLLYRAGVDQTQQHLSIRNDGNPVYYYHVSFYTNTSLHNVLSNSTILGAGHADDLAFIFYFPEANYTNDPTDPTRQTIDRVSTMWTNFAKYGNPTPSWVPEVSVGMTWPESGSSGLALNIGNELSIEPRPTNINMKLIQAANGPFHPSNGCFSLLRL